MQQDSRQQAGGIMVFIVVGLVLAALLGGAIYFSKQQGRVASQSDAAPITETAPADETPSSTTDTSPVTSESSDETTSNDPTPSQNTPATTQPATTATPAQTVPSTGPSSIPETGPTDVLMSIAGLSLLAAGVISYRRSTAAVRTQALKPGL